jgi:hypothetical protein
MKKVIAIIVVAVVIVGAFWFLTPETEQDVTVKEQWEDYNGVYECGISVMLRADIDGTEVMLLGGVVVNQPNGDIQKKDNGGIFFDSYCEDDWTINISPTRYEIPTGGHRNVDVDTYSYTISVPKDRFVTLTFIFEDPKVAPT